MAIHSSVLNQLNKIQENLISREFYLTDLVKILNQIKLIDSKKSMKKDFKNISMS